MLRCSRLLTVLTLAVAIALAFAPESRADGPKLRALVNEPVEVAGHLYPAGMLTLRSVADYNPSSSLDEVWIGDECVGLLVAERLPFYEPAAQDTVLFERGAGGRLVLVGYLLRGPANDHWYRYRAATMAANRDAAGLFATR